MIERHPHLRKVDSRILKTAFAFASAFHEDGREIGTVLLRPIIQSYVMRHRELNNFASCHMSFGLMNILPNELKGSQNLIFPLDFRYI